MKILYFAHSFGSPTTTFIRNETEYFNLEHDILFLCNSIDNNYSKPSYVNIIPFNENIFSKKLNWFLWKHDLRCNFKNRQFAKLLNKSIESFKPDVIHCHFAYEALMLLDNLENIAKHKIVIHFHGYDATEMTLKKTYNNKLSDYLSRKNIFTISCNDYFIKILKDNLKITISNFLVLRYGINVDKLFAPADKRDGDFFTFTQVSSLVEKKGHVTTLKALSIFIKRNPEIKARFFIAGNGHLKESLLELTHKLNITDKVFFLGTLKPMEVAELLNKTDVFVHHSVVDSLGDMEGIPNAIMEAMAMELPIISTIHSGIPELIEDGINGFLVHENDIETYANRMNDSIKLGRMKQNRTKIINEYNVKSHNKILLDVYKKMSAL